MQIYKFKISLINRDVKLWREIELTSSSTVAKLAYCILASVDASGSHLFNIKYKNNRFEFIFDNMDMPLWVICHNPALYKLEELNLNTNDKMLMEYDYGTFWEFEIKVISISEMKKGSSKNYPRVTIGQVSVLDEEGCFESIGKDSLKKIDPDVYTQYMKNQIGNYRRSYEQQLVNTKKLKLNFNNNKNHDNIVDFETNKLWLSIPKDARDFYLNNAFCPNCLKKDKSGVFKNDYKISLEYGYLVINGTCANCGNPIRVVCI